MRSSNNNNNNNNNNQLSHKIIWFQVFIHKTNNLPTVVVFQALRTVI